jgi:hypothetical protein
VQVILADQKSGGVSPCSAHNTEQRCRREAGMWRWRAATGGSTSCPPPRGRQWAAATSQVTCYILARVDKGPTKTTMRVAVWLPRMLCYLLLPAKGMAVGVPEFGTTMSCIQATFVQTTTGSRESSLLMLPEMQHTAASNM